MPYRKFHDIRIYTSPGSKMCELVTSYFRSNDVEFTEYDITKDLDAGENMRELSGQKQTPVIEFDGRVIIGYQPELFDLLLEDKKPYDEV